MDKISIYEEYIKKQQRNIELARKLEGNREWMAAISDAELTGYTNYKGPKRFGGKLSSDPVCARIERIIEQIRCKSSIKLDSFDMEQVRQYVKKFELKIRNRKMTRQEYLHLYRTPDKQLLLELLHRSRVYSTQRFLDVGVIGDQK